MEKIVDVSPNETQFATSCILVYHAGRWNEQSVPDYCRELGANSRAIVQVCVRLFWNQ